MEKLWESLGRLSITEVSGRQQSAVALSLGALVNLDFQSVWGLLLVLPFFPLHILLLLLICLQGFMCSRFERIIPFTSLFLLLRCFGFWGFFWGGRERAVVGFLFCLRVRPTALLPKWSGQNCCTSDSAVAYTTIKSHNACRIFLHCRKIKVPRGHHLVMQRGQ